MVYLNNWKVIFCFLTHFFPAFSFDLPRNTRKPIKRSHILKKTCSLKYLWPFSGFSVFRGCQKGALRKKQVKLSFTKKPSNCLFIKKPFYAFRWDVLSYVKKNTTTLNYSIKAITVWNSFSRKLCFWEGNINFCLTNQNYVRIILHELSS